MVIVHVNRDHFVTYYRTHPPRDYRQCAWSTPHNPGWRATIRQYRDRRPTPRASGSFATAASRMPAAHQDGRIIDLTADMGDTLPEAGGMVHYADAAPARPIRRTSGAPDPTIGKRPRGSLSTLRPHHADVNLRLAVYPNSHGVRFGVFTHSPPPKDLHEGSERQRVLVRFHPTLVHLDSPREVTTMQDSGDLTQLGTAIPRWPPRQLTANTLSPPDSYGYKIQRVDEAGTRRSSKSWRQEVTSSSLAVGVRGAPGQSSGDRKRRGDEIHSPVTKCPRLQCELQSPSPEALGGEEDSTSGIG